jgi:hypothetical protein
VTLRMKRNGAEFTFHYKDNHPCTQKEVAGGKKVVRKVLIDLLSLFSGLLVGNELAVAVFIRPVLGFRRSAPSGAAWVRDQFGIRDPANADHASYARCAVALLCGGDPLGS